MSHSQTLLQENLGFIFEATGIGMWDWDMQTDKVIYSPQWEAIVGYEPGELPQTLESWNSIVFQEDMSAFDKNFDEHAAGLTPYYTAEFRMRKKDGSVVWAQDKGVITQRDDQGNPLHAVGVIQDVTALKLAQFELSDTHEQLDFVARLAGLGTWDWDIKNDRLKCDSCYLDMLGYPPEDMGITIEGWEQFVHPDDSALVNQKLNDYISGKSKSYTCEMRMHHRDGYYFWTRDIGRIVEWDESGKPARMLGGQLDIDRVKKTETQLQRAMEEIEGYNKRLNDRIQEGIALLEAERKASQSLYDSNPQINFIADRNFHVTDCNPAALEFYGFKSKEKANHGLVQKIMKMVPAIMPNGAPSIPVTGRFADVVKLGETSFETVLISNGEEIPCHFTLKKVSSKDSWVIAVYQTDLRELKKAEKNLEHRDRLLSAVNYAASRLMSVEHEEFEKALADSMSLLGTSINVERMTVWRNDEKHGELFCTLIQQWNNETTGTRPQRQMSDVRYADIFPSWAPILRGGNCVNTIVSHMSPTERAPFEALGVISLLVVPIFIDEVLWGFVRFDECECERVFTKAETSTLESGGILIASALLREEMTNNLIETKETALQSANAKSAFLANMSHEIRTPMNAIIGMTQIAKTTDSPERTEDCLEKISVASRHLLGIINDVLDMSKIDAQKFELDHQQFDIEKMIKDICTIIASRIEDKHQHFELNCDPQIPKLLIGDELRLAQVITNLLSNAAKFTPEQGCIYLNMRKGSVVDDKIELLISILDSGIGISSEQQKSLFNAFEQADRGISRKFGGTGLGLAISKSIINAMNGEIYIDSAEGRGSCFSFNVFLNKTQDDTVVGSSSYADAVNDYDFSGKRILLVEDVEINREIVMALLEDKQLQIDSAENGMIGYETFKANQNQYDLIFMDIHMPIMDGYTSTEHIRAIGTKKAQSIPIVAMTANAFKEDIDKCKASGMNDHIAKPIDFELLLERMHKYLK